MANKTFIGATLYPWQKAVTTEVCGIPNENKVVVVKSHRQCGKSFLCENILLYYAINKSRSTNGIVSPTLNQSRAIYKEIVNAVVDSGIIKAKNEMLLTIDLINGSSIFFKSAEQRDGLRGYHINGILILDEAAYLPDDILSLVLPWRSVAKANMVVVSTPRLKDGFFYRYFMQGMARENNTVSIDWNDYDTSELLNDEQKKVYQTVLPHNQYLTEIEGQFIEGDGMVFSHILEAVAEPGESTRLYAGIDWGSGKEGDYTSLTIFNEKGEMVFLDYFNDEGTLQQVGHIAGDLIRFEGQLAKVVCENNSIGNPLTDLLRTELTNRGYGRIKALMEDFTTTNQEKVRLVAQLQVGLEQGKVKILKDSKLINELAAYQATYNSRTGNVSYNAPQGLHDDTVISTMLAYDAFKSGSYAQYTIGFVHNKRISYNRR